MSDEKWIVSDKDHLGGKPRVQGTRISLAFLLECLASGMSVAEIVDAYPSLTDKAVQGALRELAQEKEARPREDSPRRKHAAQVARNPRSRRSRGGLGEVAPIAGNRQWGAL
jgi:uncharacterized protein (DUF433 family)